jgi:D-alanyl-D-alanine carboxypeptidase/D-alanyl-D-alanine-endopeptidase (penicillin-binding protein 4)
VALWLAIRNSEIRTEPEFQPNGNATQPVQEAAVETASEKVGRIFNEWHSNPDFAGAAIGFCLLDESGKPIFASPLASVALTPASSLKTVTSGAALHILGPDFQFETVLAGTTALDANGTLAGDLILVGSGDPTLSTEDLEKVASDAVAAGLKGVTGQLRADTSVFPENSVNDFWNWGDIGNYYGAGAYGINVDHNSISISFEPGSEVGLPARVIETEPAWSDVEWINHVTTGPKGSGDEVVVYSAPYSRKITLRGTVPLGESGFTVRGAIPDPPAYALAVLKAAFENRGVKFAGESATVTQSSLVPISKHQSPPLAEIVDHLHRVSDNLETQCLFLTIGRNARASSQDVIRSFYEKAGVNFVGLRMLDGSGLARANAIRPLDLAAANFATRHSPHGQRFVESLSAYANGTVRAKRGAMSGVKTEVGFLRTQAGRELVYAVMGNALGRKVDFWKLKQDLLSSVHDAEL